MGYSGFTRRGRRILLTAVAVLLVGGLASPAPASAAVCFMAYVNSLGSQNKVCPLGGDASTGDGIEDEDPVFGIPYGVGVWVDV